MVLLGFPLLIVPLVVYNILTFIMPVDWGTELTSVALMSGATWRITLGDALLAAGLVFLLLEVIKAARQGRRGVVDHLLSLLVFMAAAAEFVLVAGAATSIFALLVLMCLVDVLAGFAMRRIARDEVIAQPHPAEPADPA